MQKTKTKKEVRTMGVHDGGCVPEFFNGLFFQVDSHPLAFLPTIVMLPATFFQPLSESATFHSWNW